HVARAVFEHSAQPWRGRRRRRWTRFVTLSPSHCTLDFPDRTRSVLLFCPKDFARDPGKALAGLAKVKRTSLVSSGNNIALAPAGKTGADFQQTKPPRRNHRLGGAMCERSRSANRAQFIRRAGRYQRRGTQVDLRRT